MRLESSVDQRYTSKKIALSPKLYQDLRKIVFDCPAIVEPGVIPEETLKVLTEMGLLNFYETTGKYCIKHTTVADLYNNTISCKQELPEQMTFDL